MGIEPTQGKSGSPTATGADATHPLWVAFADGVTGALLKAYDAAVAAGALVLRVQHVGIGGHQMPSGDAIGRPVFVQAATGLTDHPLTVATGSLVALGDKDSDAAGASDVPTADAGWAVSAVGATHVLDTVEISAGPWHDAAHADVAAAATIVVEVWMKRGSLWKCLSSYVMGNGAAVAANPDTVAGGVSAPLMRGASRYYLRLHTITVANHVTLSADLSGGVPL